MKKKVLFICTQNSARSQMAEGILRKLYGNQYEVYSAGIRISQVNPYAIKVMQEIGIDISMQYSKSIEEFKNMTFDYVITVCNAAKENCPFFSNGKKYIHKSFSDPAEYKRKEEEILEKFRQVRDEIMSFFYKSIHKVFKTILFSV
jgi:arsenate reductase